METSGVASFTHILETLLPEPHAGLLAGLLFGVKSSVPKDLYEALVTTGTLHIIALSGMNISILSGMIQMGMTPLVGRRVAGLGTLFLIVLFVWFVGPSPSIVRAAIMGGLSLTAVIFGRQYWALYAWGVAAGGMVLVHPMWVGDISFQLSVLATLGIIVFGKGSTHGIPGSESLSWKEKIRDILRDDLHITLSAQVFTVPLIFWYFHRISLVSPLANILIGWVIAPLTGLGWVTILAGIVWQPLGYVFAWVCWIALEYIVRTIYLASHLPWASISI